MALMTSLRKDEQELKRAGRVGEQIHPIAMMPTSCGGAINFFFQGRTQQDQTVTVSVVNPSPPLGIHGRLK